MKQSFEILRAQTDTAFTQIHDLFIEYRNSLAIDLCFQGFTEEVNNLAKHYGTPQGALYLAQAMGDEECDRAQAIGCVGIRALPSAAYDDACEMKRLYVQPKWRKLQVGKYLAEAAIEFAILTGYRTLLLDTLSEMEAARFLYINLGFVEIPPYYHNPYAGTHYLKLDLAGHPHATRRHEGMNANKH